MLPGCTVHIFDVKAVTALSEKCGEVQTFICYTAGPPLTRFSLLWIPQLRFLAYLRASGGEVRISKESPTVPLTQILRNT